VFGLYDGATANIEDLLQAAMQDAPLLEGKSPDGQTHKLWAIRDADALERIVRAFESQSIVIADGHHRYETALTYRDRRRAAGDASEEADYAMMTLVSIQDPGLLVLPTHRLVRGEEGETPVGTPGKALAQVVTISLSNSFSVETAGSANSTLNRLDQLAKDGKSAYGAYFGEDIGFILQPKHPAAYRYEEIANLSRLILDRLPEILEVKGIEVGFTHSSGEAICQVNAGNEWAAFLLQGLPVREVYEAARNGYLMPEKSTFFYPKLQSGVVMRAL
jgi:uncharacterized protein (DUF1015 family)